jgi:secretion/DNA translocation related CpaE-like protein
VVEPVATSAAARASWRGAEFVVVGADLAAAVVAAGLPRRTGLVIVTDLPPDDAVWRSAVALGVGHVLQLPADEPVLAELLGVALDTDAIDGRVIAVVGGCGGAGASTLAAALAVSSAAVGDTMLVDGDVLGGGLDVLLGVEREPGARWSDLAATKGRLGAAALSSALVSASRLRLLSWGRDPADVVTPDAAAAVMAAASRAFAVTVVDLPRWLGPATQPLIAAADAVVVVVPATVRATAAAISAVSRLARDGNELRLVVRDPGGGRLRSSEVAAALGLVVTATYRSEPAVVRAADRGQPPLRQPRGSRRRTHGSLGEACRRVLAELDAAKRVAA